MTRSGSDFVREKLGRFSGEEKLILYWTIGWTLSAFTVSVYLYPSDFNRMQVVFDFIFMGWTLSSLSLAGATFIYDKHEELAKTLIKSVKFVGGATLVNMLLYSLTVASKSGANFSLTGYWHGASVILAILGFGNLWIGLLYLAEFFLFAEHEIFD
jgi:hypothetical protein